jgi:hypothetical protein
MKLSLGYVLLVMDIMKQILTYSCTGISLMTCENIKEQKFEIQMCNTGSGTVVRKIPWCVFSD